MIGRTVGNWVIERKLAKGGMGEVYLGCHQKTKAQVVIKVLSDDLLNQPEFKSRFFREAKVQMNLHHPHIAQVMDYIEQDGQLFLVVEYLEGGTLADVIKTRRGIDIEVALTWILQVLDALHYAHENNVIHRDIKPANILIDQHGRAKVADFGIARIVGEETITQSGQNLGTPYYMSPEQFNQARSVDGRADVYSVGVVLFKLLTGRVPFDGGWFEIMSAHLSNPPPSPKSLNPDIPERLEQVVLKALEKNPDQRYATCKDFAAAIEPIRWELTEETVLVKPLAPRGNKPKVPLIDEAALERLRKNQDRTPMMLDLDLLPDLIIVGGYYIEGGIRDFAVWSRQMIEELGEGIQPYLERVWDEAHARLGLPIFVRIPVGDFQMGSNSGSDDERPVHKVRIRQVFEMGKYPVTQAQWEAVMGEGENPSYFKGADRPVETVSWTDAQGFIRKLNELDDRYEYRLPTEAEWEYACRAGSTGDYPRQLDEVAWYEKNSGGETHPVGKKKPNAWGLTDMHGNVWEWVQDWYGVYPDKRVTGPQGPVSGSGRVARGGAWSSEAQHCRSTHRLRIAPVSRSSVLGFRLVRTAR